MASSSKKFNNRLLAAGEHDTRMCERILAPALPISHVHATDQIISVKNDIDIINTA
jgi:hypothetical protein